MFKDKLEHLKPVTFVIVIKEKPYDFSSEYILFQEIKSSTMKNQATHIRH